MLHQHATSEGTYGLVVEHVFIELVRSAMWGLVDNQCVVVDMLLLVGYHTAIALTLSSLAREGKVELVARGAVVKRDDIVVDTTVPLLVDIDIAHADILVVGLFEAIQIQ